MLMLSEYFFGSVATFSESIADDGTVIFSLGKKEELAQDFLD
jgi:hypothetical protein